MKKIGIYLVLIFLSAGCNSQIPDKSTPVGAFSRLSRCIDTASTECLFWELDNETRWTVSSIFNILNEMRQTVNKSYPKDEALRNSVYGKWLEESKAGSDVEMFQLLCEKQECLQRLARGFGAVKELKESTDIATITTVRNETFTMKKDKGSWGIALSIEGISGEKQRLSDSLKQVKRNAVEYEQQRLATGTK